MNDKKTKIFPLCKLSIGQDHRADQINKENPKHQLRTGKRNKPTRQEKERIKKPVLCRV